MAKKTHATEECIRARRSVRAFIKKMPEEYILEKILAAGMWAPSGLNNQPWRFKVIRDDRMKRQIASCTRYRTLLENAPVAIAVFLDKEASYHREKDIMAVGACIQNMLLTAHALGLGTCWLGEILNKREAVERYCSITEPLELMALIACGYPAEKPRSLRAPLSDKLL